MDTNYTFEISLNNELKVTFTNDTELVDTLDGELVDNIELYGYTHSETVKSSQKLDKKINQMQKQFNKIKAKGLLQKALTFNRQLDIREVISRVEVM